MKHCPEAVQDTKLSSKASDYHHGHQNFVLKNSSKIYTTNAKTNGISKNWRADYHPNISYADMVKGNSQSLKIVKVLAHLQMPQLKICPVPKLAIMTKTFQQSTRPMS